MKGKKAFWIRRSHILRRDEYECSACGFRSDRPDAVCKGCGRSMKSGGCGSSWIDELEAIDALFDD